MSKQKFNIYRDGHVHVKAGKCVTCIFRPGNLMYLQPGRVKSMVSDCLRTDSTIPCHDTLYVRGKREHAVCRGFFDAYRTEIAPLRMATLLGKIREQ